MAKNSFVGILAQVLYLVTRFLLTPYVVAQAGFAAYGFWSVLFVVLGWFGVHRMGFTSSSISFVAQYHARGERGRIDACLGTCASMAALFALAVGGTLIGFATPIVKVLGTEPEMLAAAVLTFRLTVGATFFSLVFGGYQSAMEALQQYPKVKLVDASALLAEAACIVLFLQMRLGLPGLALAYALRLLLPIPCHALFARAQMPGLRPFPTRWDREEARALLGFGGTVQLMGVLHLAIASIDRLALAHLVGMASAGAYEVARKLVGFAAALPTHALGPLVPAAAELRGRGGDPKELRAMLRRATRSVGLLAAIPLAMFVAAAGPLVDAWIGAGHPQISRAIQLLAPAAYVHMTTGPATAILRGIVQPKAEMAYVIVWLVLGAILMPLGALQFGLLGVAAGSGIAQALSSSFLLVLACPRLGISGKELLNDTLGPLLAAAAPALCVAMLGASLSLDRLEAALFVVLSGSFVGLVALTLAYAAVFGEVERDFLRRQLGRLPGFRGTRVDGVAR